MQKTYHESRLDRIVILSLVLAIPAMNSSGCGDDDGSVCDGVNCSGFGTCKVDDEGAPSCQCDDGYVALGLSCIEQGGPKCGDGHVDEGETCDDGNDDVTDDCPSGPEGTCRNATCGDGFVWQGHEACDDGNQDDTDDCRNDCSLMTCGNGIIDQNEECDEGDDNSDTKPNACRTNCLRAFCGDGVVDDTQGERCDDGNDDVTDDCPSGPDGTCRNATCGDGFVWQGHEACDDGNDDTLDGCDQCAPGAIRIHGEQAGFQYAPSIAMSGDGRFVVGWTHKASQQDSGNIVAQRFDADGRKTGTEFQVNSNAAGSLSSPSLAMNREGVFVVVWESIDTSTWTSDILGKLYDAQGTVTNQDFFITDVDASQKYPSVAMENDHFVVAWHVEPTANITYGIYGRLFEVNSGQASPVDVEFALAQQENPDRDHPTVTMKNGFVAAWMEKNTDSDWDVYAIGYDRNPDPIGEEFKVNISSNPLQSSVDIASDDAGNYVIVWDDKTVDGNDTWGISAQRYQANGTSLGSMIHVNDTVVGKQAISSVAMNASGAFVVAWVDMADQQPGRWVITAHRFVADGRPVGSDFEISDNSQEIIRTAPDVAIADDGRFAVCWQEQESQDEIETDAFCRLFRPDGTPAAPGNW